MVDRQELGVAARTGAVARGGRSRRLITLYIPISVTRWQSCPKQQLANAFFWVDKGQRVIDAVIVWSKHLFCHLGWGADVQVV